MNPPDQQSSEVWFTKHEAMVSGPVTEARIRQLLLEGALELTDEISLDRQSWRQISQVPSVVPLQLRAQSGDKEAIAKVEAREQLRVRDRARMRRLPVVPLMVTLLIVGLALLVSLLIGIPEPEDTPQCEQLPAAGVNWRNCLLLGVDVGSASLAGANLNSAVLRQGRFTATNLSGADLSYADLRQADLRYAQLRHAIIVGANLQRADLRDADLQGSNLRFADLTGSRIDGVVWEAVRLDGAIWIDGRSCGDNSVGVCR
jgi:hypothetical protein